MTNQKKRKEKKTQQKLARAELKTKQCRQGFKRDQPIKKLCGSKSILEEQKHCVENESRTHRKQNDIRVILIIYR